MTGESPEERLAAALRAAVADVPEAGFDHASVVARSRRQARRRQVVIGGGVAAVVVALVGGIAVAGLGGGRAADTTTASAPPRAAARGAQQGAPPIAVHPESGLPGSGQEYATPSAPPLGPSDPTGCAPVQDPALRALINQVLPEVADAAEAPTTRECRPGGGREVYLEVNDGEFTGLLSVVYTAPGAEPSERETPVGWVRAQARTASSGMVSVTSRARADSGGVPFADRVPQIASGLAPLL